MSSSGTGVESPSPHDDQANGKGRPCDADEGDSDKALRPRVRKFIIVVFVVVLQLITRTTRPPLRSFSSFACDGGGAPLVARTMRSSSPQQDRCRCADRDGIAPLEARTDIAGNNARPRRSAASFLGHLRSSASAARSHPDIFSRGTGHWTRPPQLGVFGRTLMMFVPAPWHGVTGLR